MFERIQLKSFTFGNQTPVFSNVRFIEQRKMVPSNCRNCPVNQQCDPELQAGHKPTNVSNDGVSAISVVQCSMELHSSDLRLVLRVKLRGPGRAFDVVLEDLHLSGRLQLFFSFCTALPFPHVARVSATFLERPSVSFSLPALPSIPFVASFVNTLVTDSLCHALVDPARFTLINRFKRHLRDTAAGGPLHALPANADQSLQKLHHVKSSASLNSASSSPSLSASADSAQSPRRTRWGRMKALFRPRRGTNDRRDGSSPLLNAQAVPAPESSPPSYITKARSSMIASGVLEIALVLQVVPPPPNSSSSNHNAKLSTASIRPDAGAQSTQSQAQFWHMLTDCSCRVEVLDYPQQKLLLPLNVLSGARSHSSSPATQSGTPVRKSTSTTASAGQLQLTALSGSARMSSGSLLIPDPTRSRLRLRVLQQSLLKKLEVAAWEVALSDLPLELEPEVSRTLEAESAIHGPLQLAMRLSFRRLVPLKLDLFYSFCGEPLGNRSGGGSSASVAANASPNKTPTLPPPPAAETRPDDAAGVGGGAGAGAGAGAESEPTPTRDHFEDAENEVEVKAGPEEKEEEEAPDEAEVHEATLPGESHELRAAAVKSLAERSFSGSLLVWLHGASDLLALDRNGSSDPYCVLFCNRKRVRTFTTRTHIHIHIDIYESSSADAMRRVVCL